MNQKKCPKCGESNPPEAVMCWACYTPLTGAAVAATTATARAKAPARPDKAHSGDDDEKKAVAPWQIGAVVLALLLAGGFAFTSLSGGGPDDSDDGILGNRLPVKPPGGGVGSLVMPGAGASNSNISIGITNGTVQMPQQRSNEAPYRITTPPGRDATWPSIGVMPGTSVSTTQAAALAKAVYQQVARGRSYKGAYVYVFSDRDSATAFQNFQKSRRGAPLQNSDFSTMSAIWPKTLVRYEYNNGNEDIRYPSSNPGDWWSRDSNYTKAR